MFAALFAGAVAFTFIEWMIIAAALICLIGSTAIYSQERYGSAFFVMLVSFALFGFLNHTAFVDFLHSGSIVYNILKPVGIYLLIGLVVSFVNWVLYIWHVKARYRNKVIEFLTNSDYMASYRKDVIATLNVGRSPQYTDADVSDDFVRQVLQLEQAMQNKGYIFGRSYRVHGSFARDYLKGYSIEDAQKLIAKKMAELFPPRALQGKTILVSAVFEWPVTILSTLFSRVLTVLADKFVMISRKFVDWVSRISFGSHEIKI